MEMYVSKLKLNPTPGLEPFRRAFDPDPGQALDAHHRLIWTVFCDHEERERDFLFRQTGRTEFMSLSHREPVASPFFPNPDVRKVTLDFRAGDLVTFELRANATKQITYEDKKYRVDVVMNSLHDIPGVTVNPDMPESLRAKKRMSSAQIEGRKWLDRKGVQHGFEVQSLAIEDYRQNRLPKGNRGGSPQFSILDMIGDLRVTYPDAFTSVVVNGVGRAKAFGCGLFLVHKIRRRA
ncbi:type I-E CRISPR-associated protein Cas6/Cse3/CasE [Candidatus Poribacteria bacterium]|nr:type I-E CRISPR-associated protein Cas6/Cse3/CasE [Candidatus Poribacteria bacterium]